MSEDLCRICGEFKAEQAGLCETCAVEIERWERRLSENRGDPE